MSEQTKVDVLAVMDDAAETLRSESFYIERERLAEARAAVAALINAAHNAETVLRTLAKNAGGDLGVIVADEAMFLRAALARIEVTP